MFTYAHAAEECQPPCHRCLHLSRCSVLSFGAFISQCYSVLSFGASISQLILCFYAGDTHFYSHLKSN